MSSKSFAGFPLRGGRRSKEEVRDTLSPMISIITVVFNASSLLQETMRSVWEQTYDRIEYIVVDGASTDDTVTLLKSAEDRIDYWISEPDKGIYDAMNKGLSLACGEYVWFLNAGDTAANPHLLQEIFGTFWDSYDFYYGSTQLVHEDGRLGKVVHPPAELRLRDMYRGMAVSHQSIILRRRFAFKYSLDYRLIADQKWVVDAMVAGAKGINVKIIISHYLLGGLSDQHASRCVTEKIAYLKQTLPTIELIKIYPFVYFQHGKIILKRAVIYLKKTWAARRNAK